MSVLLVPERPIVISPKLATHLGLEEAVLLQVLNECLAHRHTMVLNNRQWLEMNHHELLSLLPFWTAQDIIRLLTSLQQQEVLLLDATSLHQQSSTLRFALNQDVEPSSPPLPVTDPIPSPPSTHSSLPAQTQQPPMLSNQPQPPAAGEMGVGNNPIPPYPPAPTHLAPPSHESSMSSPQSAQPETYLDPPVAPPTLQQEEPQAPVIQQSQPPISQPSIKVNSHPVFQTATTEASKSNTANGERIAKPITNNWRPAQDSLHRIAKLGIPQDFVKSQLPAFIVYWRDRNVSQHSWDSLFLKWMMKEWRYEESRLNREKKREAQENPEFLNRANTPVLIDRDWRPDEDVFQILERSGINRHFLEGCIPEFILYWRERGEPRASWGTHFVQHVRKQWAYYSTATQEERTPKLIPDDWTPSDDCYDIIRMANIDLAFAQDTVKEFVLYWKESKQAHRSWNAKFLTHVKFCWAKRHEFDQKVAGSNSARHSANQQKSKSLEERLTDTSWADGIN